MSAAGQHATQWQVDSPWDLDEREETERGSTFQFAWMWTGMMIPVLAVLALLGQTGVLPVIEPGGWVSILAAMTWTTLILPNAVLTWRPHVAAEA